MAGDPYAITLYANGADVYSLQAYQTSSPSIATAPNYGFPYSGSNLPDPTLFIYSGISYSFVREGYEFVEWNTAADGTGTSHNIGDNINGTFYAIWQPLATGSGGGSLTVSYDGNQIWQGTSGNLTLPTDGKMMDGDITLALTGGGGGGGNPVAEPNDVEFIDYDGTIRYSYTAAEFANLTALPANPTHEGLTAQGWNWTLADAKTYVAANGGLIIGQMYITDDGKTRIYIELGEGRLSPYLGICVNGTATIEWGDNTSSSISGSSLTTVKYTQHTYSSPGKYIIKIGISNGKINIMGKNGNYIAGTYLLRKFTVSTASDTNITNQDRVYFNAIYKVEIGTNTELGDYAFGACYGLTSITIPSGLSFGNSTFWGARSLKGVVVPYNENGFVFNATFATNYALQAISLPNVPFTINTTTPFSSCYNIKKIFAPQTFEAINNMYSNANSLRRVVIAANTTTIPSGMFASCYALSTVTIPANVTTINAAFANIFGLGIIKFLPTSPPTITSSATWNYLQSDCKIYVPAASLAAYKSATNYPSSSTYTYIGY